MNNKTEEKPIIIVTKKKKAFNPKLLKVVQKLSSKGYEKKLKKSILAKV